MLRIRKELDKLSEINASLVMEVMQLVVKCEIKDDTPIEEEFKYFWAGGTLFIWYYGINIYMKKQYKDILYIHI